MDLSKMSVEELREEVRENQDNGCATDAFDELARRLEEAQKDAKGCICQGNWRLIIKESEHLFGKKFMSGEYEYIFLGVLHGEDDYYYVMWNTNPKDQITRRYELLTCVGDLAGHGYNLVEDPK